MKRLITLILIGFSSVAAMAGHGSSSLEINVNEYGYYSFEINGYRYASHGNTLQLNELVPGSYRVRIIRDTPQHGRHYHTPRVVYDNYIDIPHGARVIANYNRFGLHVNRIVPPVHARPLQSPVCNAPVPSTPAYGMNPHEFDVLLRNIDNVSFDQTRLSIAKSAIGHNYMTTQQIAQVMRRLSFDSYRLDFAKFAYRYCVDPHNYYQLTSHFAFESNARDLMAYIG